MTFADGIFRLGVSLRYVGARVAELVDAQDLKYCFPQRKYGFDSRLGHEALPTKLGGFFRLVACQAHLAKRTNEKTQPAKRAEGLG